MPLIASVDIVYSLKKACLEDLINCKGLILNQEDKNYQQICGSFFFIFFIFNVYVQHCEL